ncbi:hypothetical protein [Flavobacterium sp. LM4]
MACYAGVAPFQYSSGSFYKRKDKGQSSSR